MPLNITCAVLVGKGAGPNIMRPQTYENILKSAVRAMETKGELTSASGLSAWAAIGWCEQNDKGFVLSAARVDGPYHIKVIG